MRDATLTPQDWATSLDSLNQDVKPQNRNEYSMLEKIKPHHWGMAQKAALVLQTVLKKKHGEDIWIHRRDYYTNAQLGEILWAEMFESAPESLKIANMAAFMANQLCDFEYGHMVSDDGSRMEEVNYLTSTRTGRMVFLYLAAKYGMDEVLDQR